MYSYTIYITVISSTLNYMYYSWVYYSITTRWTCCSHALNITVLVLFTTFQTYDIILYDILYNYSHIPLHYSRNKRKREIKSKKIDKRKIKLK